MSIIPRRGYNQPLFPQSFYMLETALNNYIWETYLDRYEHILSKIQQEIRNPHLKKLVAGVNLIHKLQFLFYREVVNGFISNNHPEIINRLRKENKSILFTTHLLFKYITDDKNPQLDRLFNRLLLHFGGRSPKIKELLSQGKNLKLDTRTLTNFMKLNYEYLTTYAYLNRQYNFSTLYEIVYVSNLLLYLSYTNALSVIYSIDKAKETPDTIHIMPINYTFILNYLPKYKQRRIVGQNKFIYCNIGTCGRGCCQFKPLFLNGSPLKEKVKKQLIKYVLEIFENPHLIPHDKRGLLELAESPSTLKLIYLKDLELGEINHG